MEKVLNCGRVPFIPSGFPSILAPFILDNWYWQANMKRDKHWRELLLLLNWSQNSNITKQPGCPLHYPALRKYKHFSLQHKIMLSLTDKKGQNFWKKSLVGKKETIKCEKSPENIFSMEMLCCGEHKQWGGEVVMDKRFIHHIYFFLVH